MKISYQALSNKDSSLLLDEEYVEQPKRNFTRVSPLLIFVFALLGVAGVKMTLQQPFAEVSVGGPAPPRLNKCTIKEGDETKALVPGNTEGQPMDATWAVPKMVTFGEPNSGKDYIRPAEDDPDHQFCLRKKHKTWAAFITTATKAGDGAGEKKWYAVKAWDGPKADTVDTLLIKYGWLNSIDMTEVGKSGDFERMIEDTSVVLTNPLFVGGRAKAFVTQWLPGRELHDALETPCERVEYLNQVMAIIDALASVGIIHMDLQSHNWYVDVAAKKVYLLDFKSAIRFTDETTIDYGDPAITDKEKRMVFGQYINWANKFESDPTKHLSGKNRDRWEEWGKSFTKTNAIAWMKTFAKRGMLWRSSAEEKAAKEYAKARDAGTLTADQPMPTYPETAPTCPPGSSL